MIDNTIEPWKANLEVLESDLAGVRGGFDAYQLVRIKSPSNEGQRHFVRKRILLLIAEVSSIFCWHDYSKWSI